MGKIINLVYFTTIILFKKRFPHYTTCITFELWANNSGGDPYIKVGFFFLKIFLRGNKFEGIKK